MLVFLYEKCRAESRGRTGEKPDEYSYRYGRWTVVPEASSTIMDSEPMHPVCLPEIKLRVSLETNWDRVESRWSIRQAATLARPPKRSPQGRLRCRKTSETRSREAALPSNHQERQKQSSSAHHEYPDWNQSMTTQLNAKGARRRLQ